MASLEQQGDYPASNQRPLADSTEQDEGQLTEQAVTEVLAGLEGMHELPVSEHVERFEAVHTVLTDALNKAENLLSGSTGNGG